MTAIVITGRKRAGPRQMAKYLLDKGENESIKVRQIGSYLAKTIPDALAEMWAVAEGSKAKDFLYHVTINPVPGVRLSQEQWRIAVDTLEKRLNLVGHQRVVVEHIKKGRLHYHVVWNRVNPLTGRAKKLSFDRRVLRATALHLGALFKLEPTAKKGQSFRRGEYERGKRTGIDPRAVKAEITALWNKAKSGKEFAASLAEHGYILARGDKSQFVIIDQRGSAHGLTRRIEGATAKIVRRGMADIDPMTLPSVAEARKQVKTARRKASIPAFTKRQITGRTFRTPSANVRLPAIGRGSFASGATLSGILSAANPLPATEQKPAAAQPAHIETEKSRTDGENGGAASAATGDVELDGILAAIADEVQRNAAGASAEIMGRYAASINHARKTLPRGQLAGAIRALIDASNAELAAISRNAAAETAGRRKAIIEQRRGKPPSAQDAPRIG